MKTTIDIPPALLAKAKSLVRREHSTLRALVEEGLRQVIAAREGRDEFHLRDASFGGDGLNPDLAGRSWDEIRDLAYKERGA